MAFPLQQLLHERASMLGCTYIGCLVRNVIPAFSGSCFRWPQQVQNLNSFKECCTFGLYIRTYYLYVNMFNYCVLQYNMNKQDVV